MSTPPTQQAPDAAVRDRQRARTERGLRSTRTTSTRDRLPSPPRRRRPALAALAVLLIVGGAALAGLLAVRLDQREAVLIVSHDVAVGDQISAADLAETSVASEGLTLVPRDQASQVIGTYARVNIGEGTLLDTSMLTTAAPMSDGLAMVGVPLTPGRAPAGLRTGDKVRVVHIGDGNTATSAITEAVLVDTQRASGDSLAGASGSSSGTLLVPVEMADAVVDAAGNDALGLALVERGVSIDGADLAPLTESAD